MEERQSELVQSLLPATTVLAMLHITFTYGCGLWAAGKEVMLNFLSVLFPVLRICFAILASLGGNNVSAAAQVLQFMTGHDETVSQVQRGAVGRAALHPALLQELALLDLWPDHADTDVAKLHRGGADVRLQQELRGDELQTAHEMNDTINTNN